ncbi:hypothetical protein TWF718_010807 [Orbilia javanica]|uniref:BTB domain-containing protein n=1 Tax=Orbilia javanica TaxID=47235 RepID=A0AAN8NMV4_9PEZI
MEDLLKSGKYSDFTIKCGSKEWKVHRAVICPQSEYFRIVCDSNFKEKFEAELDLSEESPFDVENILKFLYMGEYTAIQSEGQLLSPETDTVVSALKATSLFIAEDEDGSNQADAQQEPSKTSVCGPANHEIVRQRYHIAMYAMGDKYIIENLKTQAAKSFIKGLPAKWMTDHWCLVDDIEAKTPSTDRTLRAPIVELWLKGALNLLNSEDFRENMARFPGMELQFLRENATDMCIEISALRASLTAQSLELTVLHKKRNGVKDSIKGMVDLSLNKWSKCRHCGEGFRCHLDEQPTENVHEVSYFLRCDSCRTKHPREAVGFRF